METEVMDKEIKNRFYKFTKKKIITISLITFILLMLAAAAQLSYMILNNDKVYKGVYLNDVYAGNLSKDELTALLKKSYEANVNQIALELKSSKYSEKLNYSDIHVTYDIADAVNKAYSIGRTGNVFERLLDIAQSSRKGVNLDIPFSFDKSKVSSIIASVYSHTLVNVKEADLTIQENAVKIRSGHHGEHIDKDQTLKDITANIKLCTGGTITVPVIKTASSKINIDDYYAQLTRTGQDASYKIENNQCVFTKEVIGRSIDKAALTAIALELETTEDTEKSLPVTFIKPTLTLQEINAKLFKDELKTFTTTFKTGNTNEKNRSVNIRLDAAKINGTILAPGQVFSYNNTVGVKTPEQGYKDAFTYVAGKMIAGLGGGICQVSSTLYNAVLYSDLEVVQRRNHMFVVSYVPFGQDATVYYGSTDFQFKNTTNWPLMIKSTVTNKNQVIFSLYGTNETPDKSVKIVSKPIGNPIPFPIKYVDDPTATKEEIIQLGHNGGVYETYKVVLKNGKVVTSNKITTSYYKPLEQVIKRPPPKIPPTTPTVPTTPTAPTTPPVTTDPVPTDNPDVVN